MDEEHSELLSGAQAQQAPPLDPGAPAGLAVQPEHRGGSPGGATLPPADATALHTDSDGAVLHLCSDIRALELLSGAQAQQAPPLDRGAPAGLAVQPENRGGSAGGAMLPPADGKATHFDWAGIFAELLRRGGGDINIAAYVVECFRVEAGFLDFCYVGMLYTGHLSRLVITPEDPPNTGTQGIDDLRSFPRGVKRADTLVQATVTRRRYDEIVAICGRDSVIQEEDPTRPDSVVQGSEVSDPDSNDQESEGSDPDDMWTYKIKIPEAKFDEVLYLDTYYGGEIDLGKLDVLSPGHRGHVNEIKCILLAQEDQCFKFYGTANVFENIKAWKRRCEEIRERIRIERTGGARWPAGAVRRLAEAAAGSDECQASVGNMEQIYFGASASQGAREKSSLENTEETSSGASASEEACQESSVESMEETSAGASASQEARQESSVENTEETSSGASAFKEACQESSGENTEETSSGAPAPKKPRQESSVESMEETSAGASASQEARQEPSVENTEETSSGASASEEARQEVTEDDNNLDQSDRESDGSDEIEYHNGRYSRDFKEEKIIGEGGFGCVVKAQNKVDNVFYAVKKVAQTTRDHLSMKQVRREVEVLARLSHANIVAYKQAWFEEATASNSGTTSRDGSGTNGANYSAPEGSSEEIMSESEDIRSWLYIQMDLCGKSLDKALKLWIGRRAELYCKDILKNAVLLIFKNVLEALAYIHSEGIIHRDIKPGNILFAPRKDMLLMPEDILQAQDEVLVKLGDFGLATQTTQHESSLRPLSRQPGSGLTKGVGTAIYAAPEQMTNTSYDSKVDIYSLGVVLAELLCLFTTFHERRQLERLRNWAAPDCLEALYRKEPDLVQTILSMCLPIAELRPSAKDLLESGLVVTKHTVLTENQEKEEMLTLLIRYISRRFEEGENFNGE